MIMRRNKWRPDPQLNFQNQEIVGYIGAGAWGSVFDIFNTDTKAHYAFKVQFDLGKYNPEDLRPSFTLEPPRTASSEASKSSSQSVERRSLRAKRHQETRAYLLWIRSDHPNIVNLEAFVQFTPKTGDQKELPALGLYFEYCDAGDLYSLMDEFDNRGTKPPELFIWQVFYEIMCGLAFLHNQDPEYNQKREHLNREIIFQDDIHSGNVLLQWGSDRVNGYPHVKIADFGGAHTVPPGGHIHDPEYDSPDAEEKYQYSIDRQIKSEVWEATRIIYELAHIPEHLDTIGHLPIDKKFVAYEEMEEIDSHLSTTLDRVIKLSLTPDRNRKPLSGYMCRTLKPLLEERVCIMYKALPDWVGRKSEENKFDPERLKELDEAGGLEKELAASDRDKRIRSLASTLFDAFLDSDEFREDMDYLAKEEECKEKAIRLIDKELSTEAGNEQRAKTPK